MEPTRETFLLQEAAAEIKRLRNQVQLMNARLSMFDDVMHLAQLNLRHNGLACAPDLVWDIENFIESKKTEINQPTTKENGN